MSAPTLLPPALGLQDLLSFRARTQGGSACYIDISGERKLTYADLETITHRWRSRSNTASTGLAGAVGIALRDPLDFASTFISLIAIGECVAPLDPNVNDEALAADVRSLGLGTVVSDRTPSGLGVPLVPPVRSQDDQHTPGRIAAQGEFRSSPGAVLLRSSGTTGTRKRILLTEFQLLHTAHAVATHHKLTAEDRGLSPLPLFHVNAEVVGLLSTLVAGASLVLDDRFHRHGFWNHVVRHGVTWINAVPAILAILALEPAPPATGHRVRFARSASAPLPTAVLDRFEAATGIPVLETYGMTEAASQITANPLGGPRKAGSVGLPVDAELRVVADGRCCGPGDAGAVQIRGRGIIPGPPPGDWLDTGDVGYLDADGYVFLTGRVDDVINRGGEKIFPRDIEETILADPDVEAAAVVPRPDLVLGAVPVAFVTLSAGNAQPAARAARRVRARCDEDLARGHRPATIHVVESLPTGATGKLNHRLVREQQELLAEHAWATA